MVSILHLQCGLVIIGDVEHEDFVVPEKSSLSENKHEFQTEINRLMSILINSLYSNRDVFLRELISNSADALDKIRFIALTDPSALGEGDLSKLEIKIKVDKENNLLQIRDTGIGMTKDDLINNLGRIAKSGTHEFLEKVKNQGGDVTQIGQFGVGFYSSFLIADTVTVTTKNNNGSQHVWVSSSDDQTSYTISEDPRGDTLGRGTLITLHVKEDAMEYLDEAKLASLIKKYSEFITFPIYLWSEKEVETQVPISEDETEETEQLDEEIVDADEEEKPKFKTVIEKVYDWNLVNTNKPIWTRKPSQITEEEYNSFYETLSKDGTKPIHRSHFTAEGDVSFSALLYLPGEQPFPMYDQEKPSKIKLYVKRVFITDKFEDVIPRYLSFLVGVIDSDDIPLSISRETLQQHKAIDVIKKKVVRKAIAMFQELAQDDAESYSKFYEEYSVNLKVGVIEDTSNRNRILKLLRFNTLQNTDSKISLEEYISNMKEGQEDIYYLGGETIESVSNSPLTESFKKRGYDILLLTQPIDEYVFQTVTKYEDGSKKYKLVDISKQGLKLDKEEEELLKQKKEEFKPLTDALKQILGSKVEKVTISSRLTSTPCALTTGAYGFSANMERIIKSQALQDGKSKNPFMGTSQKNLELNPDHHIIKQLLKQVVNGEQNKITDTAKLMYDAALVSSGFSVEEPATFASRIYATIENNLGTTGDVDVETPVSESKDEL